VRTIAIESIFVSPYFAETGFPPHENWAFDTTVINKGGSTNG